MQTIDRDSLHTVTGGGKTVAKTAVPLGKLHPKLRMIYDRVTRLGLPVQGGAIRTR